MLSAEWLSARAMLAGRRSGRLALVTLVTFLLVLASLFMLSSPIQPAAGWTPPIAAVAAAFVLAAFVGFCTNLVAEMTRPKIASSREAERAAGAPVVGMVRVRTSKASADRSDPFHVLYLGLTTTGRRPRLVTITGDSRAVVATTSGKLALAAAADATATLVVDADAEGSAVAGYYGVAPEPGFTDAIAGVRLWREVTRPIGASAGLAIDVVPGGAIRDEATVLGLLPVARSEFARFRAQYDLCVVAAPTSITMTHLCGLVDAPILVVCAVLGETTLEGLRSASVRLRKAGARIHGVLLWDGALPFIESRNVLMAKVLAPHRP